MRTKHLKTMLALAAASALALPVTLHADDVVAASWQGQGRGHAASAQGRGNQGRGNQSRGNADAAQGRGNQGRGNSDAAQGRGNQGRGNSSAAGARGNSASGRAAVRRHDPARPDAAAVRASFDRMPESVRRLRSSDRRNGRLVAGALALAALRGVQPESFRIEQSGERVRVKNSRDQVLLDMDEDRAEHIGHWEMRRLGDRRPNDNSPAFCRSGAGHPVWGREWCIDKGFGLGVSDRSIWSRADDDLGVIFRGDPDSRAVLDRGGLIDVLGDIVFGRLALQSLVLGHDEPLVGRWVAGDEPDAPYVLHVRAGDTVIAELVDEDRDDDVDVLFVAQPRW